MHAGSWMRGVWVAGRSKVRNEVEVVFVTWRPARRSLSRVACVGSKTKSKTRLEESTNGQEKYLFHNCCIDSCHKGIVQSSPRDISMSR